MQLDNCSNDVNQGLTRNKFCDFRTRKNGRLALISDFGRKATKADIFGNPVTSTRTKFGRPHQEEHMIPARRGPEIRQPW